MTVFHPEPGHILRSTRPQSAALPHVCTKSVDVRLCLSDETHRQRFANAAKINDFSSKDLYFPDPDRTRSIFSAFINFIKFSEQSEAFINRLREQSTAVIRERQVVTEEIQDLQEKMEGFK